MDDAGYDQHGALYFTACLLSFYQQLWLWDTHRDRIAEFNIEKPLWVFVTVIVLSRYSSFSL